MKKPSLKLTLVVLVVTALLIPVGMSIFNFIAAAKFKAVLGYVGGLRVDACTQRLNTGKYPEYFNSDAQIFDKYKYSRIDQDSYEIRATYIDLHGRSVQIEANPFGVRFMFSGESEWHEWLQGDSRCSNLLPNHQKNP